MTICPRLFFYVALLICLSGCNGMHWRPANVPSSAVWVDNTFVDCTVDIKSQANHCTVYGDKTGEILADGLFILDNTHRAADSSRLRYAAFSNKGIYLEDAHILMQSTASTRDPSSRIMANRLKSFASMGDVTGIDCNAVNPSQNTSAITECALSAFAAKKPFYVRYYFQYPESFQYTGLVGTPGGIVYQLIYSPGETIWVGVPDKTGKLMDGNHIFAVPCPEPVKLTKLSGGELTCNEPVSRVDLLPHHDGLPRTEKGHTP